MFIQTALLVHHLLYNRVYLRACMFVAMLCLWVHNISPESDGGQSMWAERKTERNRKSGERRERRAT